MSDDESMEKAMENASINEEEENKAASQDAASYKPVDDYEKLMQEALEYCAILKTDTLPEGWKQVKDKKGVTVWAKPSDKGSALFRYTQKLRCTVQEAADAMDASARNEGYKELRGDNIKEFKIIDDENIKKHAGCMATYSTYVIFPMLTPWVP
jgi:hypothetical protein